MNRSVPSGGAGAALTVLGAGLAFAVSSPLARWARPFHPLGIACGRVLLASLVLALLGGAGLRQAWARLSGRDRAAVLGVGAVLAGHFALFQWGLDTTSLPAAVSLVSLEPLSVVLWAWALQGVRPERHELIGVGAATLGAILVARGAGTGEHRLLGDALVLGAVVLFGAYISFARQLQSLLAPRHYATLVYAGAAVVLGCALPFVPVTADTVLWPIPRHALVALGLLALVPTTIGHTTVQAAARRLSPAVVALVSPIEALGGLLIAALFLRSWPTPVELGGAAFIIGGVLVALLGAVAVRGVSR